MKIKKLERISLQDAYNELEQAVASFVKEARWVPYKTKINELRIPLIRLRKAKRVTI